MKLRGEADTTWFILDIAQMSLIEDKSILQVTDFKLACLLESFVKIFKNANAWDAP